MASPDDIVEMPGEPGHFARRAIVDPWIRAGQTPVNSAGRLYWEQKQAWIRYQNGTGSPADNPDDPSNYQLGHCRFVALDIDATPQRVRELEAQGLIRPFAYESWHWTVPNIYDYSIVSALPDNTDYETPAKPKPQEIDMIAVHAKELMPEWRFLIGPGYIKNAPGDEAFQYAAETGQGMNDLDNDWFRKAIWNHGLHELFPTGSMEELRANLEKLGGGGLYLASWADGNKTNAAVAALTAQVEKLAAVKNPPKA
jgi:hypothetical protein